MDTMKIIAVSNQKGGTGKTTTALNLGAALTLRGRKVLLIDLDSQTNLSYAMDANATGITGHGSLDVLEERITAAEAIQHTAQGDVIAASPALAGADLIITQVGKEYRLREALEPLEGMYDYCIIDTPPALGILTINALTAADACIIPAQADIFSLQGIGQLYNTIQTVRKYCNPRLTILGILLTRYNPRAIISREVGEMAAATAEGMGSKVFTTKIRECTALKEAQALRSNIFDYARSSNAAADYTSFTEELLIEEEE